MGLQTFTANKDVNDSVINQIVLATERPKLTVKCGRAAATLRSLVPLYPIRLAAITAVLAFVAIVASLLPALRAASIDPIQALRAE